MANWEGNQNQQLEQWAFNLLRESWIFGFQATLVASLMPRFGKTDALQTAAQHAAAGACWGVLAAQLAHEHQSIRSLEAARHVAQRGRVKAGDRESAKGP